MNPARLPDAPLYELAINSESASPPLQISPTTFKSLVEIVFDLLIDRQIPAAIWMKLPRGEVWEAEIRRFCQAATAPYCIYNLQTYQENTLGRPKPTEAGNGTEPLPDPAVTPPQVHVEDLPSPWDATEPSPLPFDEAAAEQEDLAPTDAGTSRVYTLPLAADSQLKREYFLLVVSSEFCGGILAHRPRLVRSRPAAAANPPDASSTPAAQAGAEAGSAQKHPLLAICSFEQGTIQRLLESINSAIACGQLADASTATLDELLLTWEKLTAQGMVPASNPLLLSDLLTKQIQRQEELWRSGLLHRRQAAVAAALQQENEELLNTIRGKDEFVKTMGQELRTPLTSMKTALSLLSSPNLKAPQRQKYMEMLSQECDRQSSLISSVLDLVQIESVTEPVPLEALRLIDVVPSVVSTYQPLAQEKGIILSYTIPEGLPPVACLNSWLKQIVINLLHNSIKFTPGGGQVWVRARPQGDLIQLEFRDTGLGIAPGEIPKIFDRFYRVRAGQGEDASGSGLGLSIVQQLLLRCGGSISVRSKPGEGSMFSVLLSVYGRDSG